MTINYRRAFLGMLFGSLLLSPLAAHAATWSTSASACTPGDGTIGRFVFDEARFTFASGHNGDITVRCHIPNPLDDSGSVPIWNTLTVGFQDPDSNVPTKTYTVTVKLLRVHKDSGVVSLIRLFDSNALPTASPSANSRQINFTHNFDFQNYAYYVNLTLSRSSLVLNPAVWYVKLSTT